MAELRSSLAADTRYVINPVAADFDNPVPSANGRRVVLPKESLESLSHTFFSILPLHFDSASLS